MTSTSGRLFVLSAPSGTGKSTLARRLLTELPGLGFSVSYTTRPPRPGEVDGRDYFFVDDDTFDRMVAEGGFVEWVRVYAHRYGTGRAWLEAQMAAGRDILMDIETVGARAVKAAIPEAIMIFLLPPSAQELERRLRGRGDTDEAQVALRLNHARHELLQFEAYDHLIVNDELETAYQELVAVFRAERSRRSRRMEDARRILATFG